MVRVLAIVADAALPFVVVVTAGAVVSEFVRAFVCLFSLRLWFCSDRYSLPGERT